MMYLISNKVLAVLETVEGWTILFEGGEKLEGLMPNKIQEVLDYLKSH